MSRLHILLLSLLAVALCDDTYVLVGTARDFTPYTHPDFESYKYSDKGIPQTFLDQDGKPVLNGTHPTITSASSFAQWYRSVENINIEIQINITLTLNSTTGVYTYANRQFFPIDGKGFGDYGNEGHNFHFTTEFRTSFVYKGGEQFTFTGDDDVFVFINNKLALDLGGIHPPQTATIYLDSLGLTAGNNYSLVVFHAERHTSESSFRIDTTIDLKPQENNTTPVNPGREVSICEVVIPNFCPGVALDDAERCPQTPMLHFPDGTTQDFESFNAISFGDFTNADGGDIEGRLAVRDNVHLYSGHYSVGYELRTGGASAIDVQQKYSLVVGGDAYFPSGAIYPLGNNVPYQAPQEFGFVGGKFDGADYIAETIVGKCNAGGCLNNDFDQARIYYSAVQDAFFSVTGNVGATFTIDGASELKITCSSNAVSSVSLTLTAAQLSSVLSYDTSSCNAEAQIVINVPNPNNEDVSFTGNNINHRAEKVLFNIGGTGTIKVSTKIVGSILAPDATLEQPSGVIVGLVIVAEIAHSLQINRLNCVQVTKPHNVTNETSFCPSFEDDCDGLTFPLGDGVYSFRDFNVISFDSFTGNNGDVEGRLAVRNNVHLGADGYSIGYELSTAAGGPDNSLPYSLVVGGDLVFMNGAVFPDGSGKPHTGAQEHIFVGGTATVPDYLDTYIKGSCGSNECDGPCPSSCLDIYFDAAKECYTKFSDKLEKLEDNTKVKYVWNGAFITCDSNTTETYVVSITGAQFANISWYTTTNCSFQSQWVINVRGTENVRFFGDSFPGVAGAIVYNVIGSGRVITVEGINLVGNLLAPENTLYQPTGVINGKVVVHNVTASLQINREGQCPEDKNVTIVVPITEDADPESEVIVLLANTLRVNDVISAGDSNSYTVVDVSDNSVMVQPKLKARYAAGTLVSTRVSSLTTRPQVNSTYVPPSQTSASSATSSQTSEEENGAAQVAAAIMLVLLALAL